MKIPNETTSFYDFVEYGDFEIAIHESDSFTEVEVDRPYAKVGLEEKWFKNSSNGEVWRLVRPDPPFKGNWSKVA
ncbi:hypothetical protein [Enterovibrio norvegicus]|uniref:hypothetical protein n=1 Tax=Enterovibrio norvegicus TaxID=188144 RepID=UPI003552981B